MSKAPGIGAGKPAHPFAVTVEEPVAYTDSSKNSIVPDGYGIKYHAYHTIGSVVSLSSQALKPPLASSAMEALAEPAPSLPTGTQLPGGAVLPMSSIADFPMVLPPGTKLPGGVMVPIVMERITKAEQAKKAHPDPICSVQ